MTTALPSILQSASNLYQAGSQQLDKAAAEVAEGTQQLDGAAQNPSNNPPTDQNDTSTPITNSPAPDTLTQGLLDTVRARLQISTATVLLHTYNRTTDDLVHMLDPNHRPRD